jgi:adenylate cyclase
MTGVRMLELHAEGPEVEQRCRFVLRTGHAERLGRSPASSLRVPWEPCLSQEHLQVLPEETCVTVSRLVGARNPVFVGGAAVEESRLSVGDRFVVGETIFTVVECSADGESPAAPVYQELTFARGQLQRVRFEDADRRLEVLSRLPEVIGGAGSESERDSRLVNLVLAGIRSADAAALVRLEDDGGVAVIRWDRRQEIAGPVRPSRRLVLEALARQKQTVLHVWESTGAANLEYTASGDLDWAFCTPISEGRSGPMGVYVAGRRVGLEGPFARNGERAEQSAAGASSEFPNLYPDVKFAELVAEVMSAVERVNRMEADVSVLRQFLSPPILHALEQRGGRRGLNSDLLEPRECEVTVLFCDLRGSSHKAEEAGDDLLGLLDRVSKALEVMSSRVLAFGGVTGDFLGDAVLGFWGWPFPNDEAPLNACRAALAIRRTFAGAVLPLLSDFRVGIGIARGRAVAGKIGTSDRMSVTVFGPVVNLASRLEAMTKHLRVPILVDESTAQVIRARLPADDGRIRKLGRVLPYGLEKPLVVHELLPPAQEEPELTDRHLAAYEQGVDAFMAGEWEQAYRLLHSMPPSDQAQDFLTARIVERNRLAPPGWDGIVRLPEK